MSCRPEFTPEARDDLNRLVDHLRERTGDPLPKRFADLDDDSALLELKKEAVRLVLSLAENPKRGEPLYARVGTETIAEGRRIRFDRPGYRGKPRFRIVYDLLPNEGNPERALVYIIAEREHVYTIANARVLRGFEP
jgi:plasmid stabilization system protein ParE